MYTFFIFHFTLYHLYSCEYLIFAFSKVIQVHLADGYDMYHGRVVVEYMNRQGTICRNHFDQNDGKVLCRMLGYR